MDRDLVPGQKPRVVLIEPEPVPAIDRDLPVWRAQEEWLAVLDDDGVADAADGGGLIVAEDFVLAARRRSRSFW